MPMPIVQPSMATIFKSGTFDPWPGWVISGSSTTTSATDLSTVTWTIWTDSAGSEIGSTATSSLIWDSWSQNYTTDRTTNGRIIRRAMGTIRVETPEEAQAQLRRHEEWKAKQLVIEGERAKARERASKLLNEALAPAQREQLATKGYFDVLVPQRTGGARQYRIRRGRSRNVQQIEVGSERVLKHLCAHPIEMVPDEDTMLAQKLYLETQEENFLRIANHS